LRNRLFSRSLAVISSAVLAAAILAVAAVVLILSMSIAENAYVRSNADGLERAAFSAEAFLPEHWAEPGHPDEIALYCARVGANSGYRVTLVDASGKVLGDSDADPLSMADHSDRPEVAGALAGSASWSRRLSATTGEWLLYAAIPLYASATGKVQGALRLALPLPGLMESLKDARRSMILAACAVILAALAGSVILVHILDRPVILLSERARLYAKGEPDTSPANGAGRGGEYSMPRELRILEESLDRMASELNRKAAEAEAMGKRFSAILESAGEAIIALDLNLRILEANPAAHAMLGVEPGSLPGSILSRIAGISTLVTAAHRCITAGAAITDDIQLYPGSGKTVHVNASLLGGAGKSGIVLAITDISVLKRLETMRTDFVANVSHELRTPIHLIRGFAETLRSGGNTQESTERYLEIIEKNALRMERIVEDLLSLARLEREPSGWLSVESCSIADIGKAAFDSVRDQAEAKSVRLVQATPDSLSLTANPGLIEQALVNLLENAVRYSPSGAEVRLEAEMIDNYVDIHVRDRGSGIPAPDLARIFERFYRADKSRDRKSGGTGLGLAIVRHIALAHGGRVRAESWSGEGSVFTISLPVTGPRFPPEKT